MANEKLAIGEISKPRFEFRTFGQSFDQEIYRMTRLSEPVPEKVWDRQSEEIYIVSRKNDINNTKIRDGKMDIKTFVQQVDGLEQWNPLMKAEFPISADILKNEVFRAFQVTMPNFNQDKYSLDEFLSMVADENDLLAVRVQKHRFGYMLNGTICEVADVLINGALVTTLNSESTEIEDIKKTMKDVGLDKFENINYLQAIKRITGLINRPLADETLF